VPGVVVVVVVVAGRVVDVVLVVVVVGRVVVVMLVVVVGRVVVDVLLVVVVGRVVDVVDVVTGRVVVVTTSVVVVRSVVVVVVGGRVDVVGDAQLQSMQDVPSRQGTPVSHASPAPASSRRSPQAEAGAAKRCGLTPRAVSVPVMVVQPASSTFAFRRTLRSPPHVVQ
jgi:hypothetical protein